MATTVIGAFSEFSKNIIDLDADETATARSSRAWLVDRIHEFPGKDANFPSLNNSMDIYFGSFERKTKKRLLNDIDIMICMTAEGASYEESGKTLSVTTTNQNSPLYNFRQVQSDLVHSQRVINKFVSLLSGISQYGKAEINRRGEAATLNLASYDWTFDIVPCFITTPEWNGKTYYVIPDGSGNWKKTDPRIDRDRANKVSALRGESILGIVRLIKYWNGRPTMPSIPSYAIENMVFNYYEINEATKYPDWEFRKLMNYISTQILYSIPDPKGIQDDLNTLNWDDRLAVSNRCNYDHQRSTEAIAFEQTSAMEKSIRKWGEIFGSSFPVYG